MKTFNILGRKAHPYQASLLELCESLHMLSNGSMECYDPVTPYLISEYLRQTLEQWTERNYSVEYDAIVKSLIERALFEYGGCPWKATDGELKEYVEKYPKIVNTIWKNLFEREDEFVSVDGYTEA